ncbi:hypothetical protein GTW68_30370 [Streptomyces sp. SID4945]|nr:hypothetical protein [Streptomyces sp. SID4945]
MSRSRACGEALSRSPEVGEPGCSGVPGFAAGVCGSSGVTSLSIASNTEVTSSLTSTNWTGSRPRSWSHASRWVPAKEERAWR